MEKIDADTAVSWLKNGQPSALVVDVRDADREGGHIRGSVHVPSSTLHAAIDAILIPKLADLPPDTVLIVHCMHSQIRGPKAAGVLKSILPDSRKIVVLEGGFYRFQETCKRLQLVSALIEDYDQEAWDNGWIQ